MLLFILLNLSKFSLLQRKIKIAIKIYYKDEDMIVLSVDPILNEVTMNNLVNKQFYKIAKGGSNSFHIMDVLNFCVALVSKLTRAGLSFLASTTHRTTEDRPDGTKISKFEFVRFRKYGP